MDKSATLPRHPAGIAFIALFFGAMPLMLWMGRGKWASIYLLLGVLLLLAFFGAVISGALPMHLFAGVSPAIASYVSHLVLALIAIPHALAIRRQALERPWYSRWYVALPSTAVLGLGAGLMVRAFLFQPFNTSSTSMEPSLMMGDYFFVSKSAYLMRDPEQGEIAVFRLPSNPSVESVKRVVGLPGDFVQMKDGVLWINGAPVRLEPVEFAPAGTQGGKAMLYRETLPNGRSYVVADSVPWGAGDTIETITVPPDMYFVLGDNRDNSQDNRYAQTGLVPRNSFIGPVALRFWNDAGVALTGRP